jgi:chromosome condensin MukBEF ATPase and DNA-binding subunit MukB
MAPILAYVSKTETDALVEEIEQIRLRLAGTVDELVDRAHPRAIAQRAVADLKSNFVDETGSPRMDRIVPVVAGAVAVVAGLVLIRRLTR